MTVNDMEQTLLARREWGTLRLRHGRHLNHKAHREPLLSIFNRLTTAVLYLNLTQLVITLEYLSLDPEWQGIFEVSADITLKLIALDLLIILRTTMIFLSIQKLKFRSVLDMQ